MQGGIKREKIPQGEELSVIFHCTDYSDDFSTFSYF